MWNKVDFLKTVISMQAENCRYRVNLELYAINGFLFIQIIG